MGTQNELVQRLEDGYNKFSKGQKKLADFIREDYDKAAIDCRSTNYISYYIGNNLIEKFEIPDIYTLRFNDVQISKQNNYLKIYVGFIHNDLGTRYSALDIVVPINKNWY